MEWSDEAIVLSVRRHGESSAVLETLTRLHGRHLGLVRGMNSQRARPVLQPGNTLQAHWRARLEEHLGNYSVEPVRSRAGTILEHGDALAGLNAFTCVAGAALPEREAHEPVFHVGEILLDAIAEKDFAHWAPLYIRWEAGLLDALGFGLDLTHCASTGETDDLIYVSPKSGRAVSAKAGEPYRGKLLNLPPFLLGSQNSTTSPDDIVAGLRLTAYFLRDRVLQPHGRDLPPARLRLDDLATRESA
jgi:DNA repair protein RecO (recombination protein O)